jgi:hypothetical protein
VRVTSARPRPGLNPVGIFAARWRGEVFLTEEDILRLETLEKVNHLNDNLAGGAIALVIAGVHAGFFVRELDGSMQTIQSHEEFKIRALSPKTNRVARLWKFLKDVRLVDHLQLLDHLKLLDDAMRSMLASVGMCAKQMKPWLPHAIALAAVILCGNSLLRSAHFTSATPLRVQEHDGQLQIGLSPKALSPGARLQIVDGAERRSILISSSLTSVLYAPLTRDVRISIVP